MLLLSMRRWFGRALGSVLCAGALSLASGAAGAGPDKSGELRVVTYNVAGLPEGMSGAHPSVNIPMIGGLLSPYDVALIQEDFAYAVELRRGLRHGYVSPAFERGKRLDFGDGLSQFAKLPFTGYVREAWQKCHGILDSYFDCLTPKGFTWSRQVLSDGVTVDVYNVHLDAGGGAEDKKARGAQVDQLIRAIRRFSPNSALIVGGDTNLRSTDANLLERLQRETGLRDSCRALKCSDPGRIDRIFYRSSFALTFRPKSWRIDTRLVDANRRPLSDHLAVAVLLSWSQTPELAERSAIESIEVGKRAASSRL